MDAITESWRRGAARMNNALLDCYEAIADASGGMLAAARRSDWNGLVAAERDCAASIDLLKSVQECAPPLDPAGRRRKVAILRKVLANDAEIRTLTQPWLARLQDMLSATATPPQPLAEACR